MVSLLATRGAFLSRFVAVSRDPGDLRAAFACALVGVVRAELLEVCLPRVGFLGFAVGTLVLRGLLAFLGFALGGGGGFNPLRGRDATQVVVFGGVKVLHCVLADQGRHHEVVEVHRGQRGDGRAAWVGCGVGHARGELQRDFVVADCHRGCFVVDSFFFPF